MKKVVEVKHAGRNHRVVTVTGEGGYRRKPCQQCPWRVDQSGKFPADAFRHAAGTSYDAALHMFGCHMSGVEKGATCAGFLLQNAEHNVCARISARMGRLDLRKVHDGGLELHRNYRAMAVANGVPADDPALALCRGNDETAVIQRRRKS